MQQPTNFYQKETKYFYYPRPEMLPFIPKQAKKILDVGCGAGAFGKLLKEQRSAEVWGVEPQPEFAAEAAKYLDRVITGEYPGDGTLPENYFDCVVLNDVLEHMLDPWGALKTTHKYLAYPGHVVASIPNIRFLPYAFRLLFKGEWEYRDAGILDRTHLRFFTKQSMLQMFVNAGFDVLEIKGTHSDNRWKVNLFRRLLPNSEETKHQTFAILARQKSSP